MGMPIDSLNDQDKETFKHYCDLYGNVASVSLEAVLDSWNKNKIRLYKAFGKQLRISKNISIPRNKTLLYQKLNEIYHPLFFHECSNILYFKDKDMLIDRTKNEFLADALAYVFKYAGGRKDIAPSVRNKDIRIFSKLFGYENVESGYVCNIDYHKFSICKSTVKKDMKIIRTIQKVLSALEYPHMEYFEQWKNKINNLALNQDIRAKLVLSIHPIDYITMSDNKCNWHSCMSWTHEGCYRAGTIEMMNSRLAVVAYLENETPYRIGDEERYTIPNKSWRALLFVHKDLLLIGKNYPYYNEGLCHAVLDVMREQLHKTLKWKYAFINQRYYDSRFMVRNDYLRDSYFCNDDSAKRHYNIFVYTYGMYNDIIEDPDGEYWCCRNKPKKSIKISLSGAATCFCCGKKITDINALEPSFLGSSIVCYDCQIYRKCSICGKISAQFKYSTKIGQFCSDDCFEEAIYFPGQKRIMSKEQFLSYNNEKEFVLFVPDTYQAEKLTNVLTHMSRPIDSNFSRQDLVDFLATEGFEYLRDYECYKVPPILIREGYKYFPFTSYLVSKVDKVNLYMRIYPMKGYGNRCFDNAIAFQTYIPVKEYLEVK